MFPKILNTFTVKICYKGCGLGNYLILYCCKQTSDSTCAVFLLPRRVLCSVVDLFRIVLIYFNILDFLFVFFCEVKVIMLLKGPGTACTF